MGILTRKQDDVFVITSDRQCDTAPTARAPNRPTYDYRVWTGTCWSSTRADAVSFASLDAADEYVRANFAKVTS